MSSRVPSSSVPTCSPALGLPSATGLSLQSTPLWRAALPQGADGTLSPAVLGGDAATASPPGLVTCAVPACTAALYPAQAGTSLGEFLAKLHCASDSRQALRTGDHTCAFGTDSGSVIRRLRSCFKGAKEVTPQSQEGEVWPPRSRAQELTWRTLCRASTHVAGATDAYLPGLFVCGFRSCCRGAAGRPQALAVFQEGGGGFRSDPCVDASGGGFALRPQACGPGTAGWLSGPLVTHISTLGRHPPPTALPGMKGKEILSIM